MGCRPTCITCTVRVMRLKWVGIVFFGAQTCVNVDGDTNHECRREYQSYTGIRSHSTGVTWL